MVRGRDLSPSPGRTLFIYHSGPDDVGRYRFSMLWWQVGGIHFDADGRITNALGGPKAQCFMTNPEPYRVRALARGDQVVEIDQREVRP